MNKDGEWVWAGKLHALPACCSRAEVCVGQARLESLWSGFVAKEKKTVAMRTKFKWKLGMSHSITWLISLRCVVGLRVTLNCFFFFFSTWNGLCFLGDEQNGKLYVFT